MVCRYPAADEPSVQPAPGLQPPLRRLLREGPGPAAGPRQPGGAGGRGGARAARIGLRRLLRCHPRRRPDVPGGGGGGGVLAGGGGAGGELAAAPASRPGGAAATGALPGGPRRRQATLHRHRRRAARFAPPTADGTDDSDGETAGDIRRTGARGGGAHTAPSVATQLLAQQSHRLPARLAAAALPASRFVAL